MFYNRRGLAIFTGAYVLMLAYSGLRISELTVWEPRNAYALLLWLLFGATMPLGLLNGKYSIQLYRIGGVAMMFVLHFTIAFIVIDLWRFLSYFTRLPSPAERALIWALTIAMAWTVYGVTRAQRLKTRKLELELSSKIPRRPIKIAAVADIHAGGIVNRGYLNRLFKTVASHQPDVLLLLGDVTDGDINDAVNTGFSEILAAFNAPLGKYAVLGNHDIYAGTEAALSLLEKAGVTVLQDESLVIDGCFLLVGRIDPRGVHFGLQRAALSSLLPKNLDGMPVIVADHTPKNIDEAVSCKVSLQLSGHTHGGQAFPLNLIMKRMYGISSGVLRKGETTICVSSGAGLWTMPLRTVTDSEIVLCTISFK